MARFDPAIQPENVLAERSYLVSDGETENRITVKIAFPVLAPEGDFVCSAEIGDDSNRIVRPMRGQDVFGALFNAVMIIAIEFPLFADVVRDRFTWNNGRENGLCFPTAPHYSLDCS